MKHFFQIQIVKIAAIGLLTFISTGIFAQTTIALDPACQSCPPSATLNSSALTPVPTPVPSCGTVAGTYKVGTALDAANTITLSLNVVTIGGYTISTTANGMTFTGSGTFAGTGAQSVTLTGSGTPLKAETTAVMVQYGGTTCSVAITVASNAPTAAAPPVGATNSGNLSGKTCFDVAISNNNINGCALLTARTPQKADFTLAATNQQIYTFKPRGTVSNVRFSYVNTNGDVITAITGGNPGNNITTAVTATASFNTGLNAPATGLTNANALTADIYVIFNDGATNNGTDRQLKITPKVKDCACCGAFSYQNFTSTVVWVEFMCHNVGADESKDPFKYSVDIIGDYYQWGRRTDGHEKLRSKHTITRYPNQYTPDDAFFVAATAGTASTTRWDLGTGAMPLSWAPFTPLVGGVAPTTYPYNQPKGPTDPCPAGWKVPGAGIMSSLFRVSATLTKPLTSVASSPINPVNVLAGYPPNGLGMCSIGSLLYLPYGGEILTIDETTQQAAHVQHGFIGLTGTYALSDNYFSDSVVGALHFDIGNTSTTIGVNPPSTGKDPVVNGRSIRCVIDK